ncbi:MAG: 50S ribosomal protein L24 [Planctomycetota bacterium]
MAQRIKTGDNVAIITGKDKGKTGRVQKVMFDANGTLEKVVVEGMNRKTKMVKPSQQNQQGGKVTISAPIHASNVMPVCPETDKPTRVRFEERDGVKHRVAVKSGASLGPVKKSASK